ncbi:multiple epidermal growth factor-like domains protein 10 isoform X3 [Crassostrea angulata]|uniref:multiple epidermal growth factor-like domains protein 10 isoform X3 n=1 Tax=Magallana angulata TaxID=2784310 RepID=UPI0022B1A874|nr:multiple epidermal growth factor-like domains protein 10 isoform X3 [Crassostrea angulata]
MELSTLECCKRSGMYRDNCDKYCPTNCKDHKCHIHNGTCYACQPGWMGTTCNTKCRDGMYGFNCSHQCSSHCRDRSVCSHVTGQCDRGCDAGWTELFCYNECINGTYGYDCVNNCSGHCQNNYPCNKQTGLCDTGCNLGYTNNYCSKICPQGYYGEGCKYSCGGHCVRNEPCDHVNGLCSNGCQDGYIGLHCNSSCRDGYYGRNCSHVCPFTCQTCRHTDGLCTCKAGWTGQRCNEECGQSFGVNCQYQCSEFCINRTCDRFSGSCMYGCMDGKKCYEDRANLQKVDPKLTVPPSMAWIVGFSLSLAINVFVISAILIRLWKKRSKRPQNQSDTNDDGSHYQELSVSKGDKTYQTLTVT